MSLENCPQCGEPYTIHSTGGCPRMRYGPELFPGAGAARIAQLEAELAISRAKEAGLLAEVERLRAALGVLSGTGELA